MMEEIITMFAYKDKFLSLSESDGLIRDFVSNEILTSDDYLDMNMLFRIGEGTKEQLTASINRCFNLDGVGQKILDECKRGRR